MKEDEQVKGTVCLADIDSNSQDIQLKFKLRLQERERLISLNQAIEIEIAKCLQDTKEQIDLLQARAFECNIKFQNNEDKKSRIVKERKEKNDRKQELIIIKDNLTQTLKDLKMRSNEKLNRQHKPLFYVTLDSIKMKFDSFLKSCIYSISIFLFLTIFLEKNLGIFTFVSQISDVNHYYISFVIVRTLCYVVNFMTDVLPGKYIKESFYFLFIGFFWVLTSIGCVFLFPQLTGKNYLDSSNAVVVSISVSDKVCILALQFFSSFISQLLSSTCFSIVCVKFKQDWLTRDVLEDKKKQNVVSIFLRNVKVQGIFNSLFWILFFILILLSSISSIPNLDANVEVIIFGYLFPFIKTSVVTLCYNMSLKAAAQLKWSESRTSSMVSTLSAVAVIICSLPQLYFIFRFANDYSFFLYQFLPHEVIKKLSWLTFHPLYLKVKMQVVDILSSSFNSVFKNRDKVDPTGVEKVRKKRFTLVVNENLDATAGEIVGRQLGEDLCMILMAIWMLPLCQEYLFASAYPSSSSLPFPSYESIGIMIIGTAYGTETILTVVCFVILQRVGIPLMDNRQVMEFDLKNILMNVVMTSCFIIVLAATLLY